MSMLKEYSNHSGGAAGADSAWDIYGLRFGMNNNYHYFAEGHKTPRGNVQILKSQINEPDELLRIVNEKHLHRRFPGKNEIINNLIRRNYWQVKNAEAVYAISSITDNVVNGGTGWAVHMAIELGKPVFVFDQNQESWFTWEYGWAENARFVACGTPVLTKNFAGIGTRELTEKGKQAILNVYSRTVANLTDEPEKNKVDKEDILNGYKWIKVKKYKDDPSLSWEERYKLLEAHHVEETTFLINKIREIVKDDRREN